MQPIRTYRHYWIGLLAALLVLSTSTQVLAKTLCPCPQKMGKAVAAVPAAPKASCCHAPKSNTAPAEAHCAVERPAPSSLEGCCCDKNPQWSSMQPIPVEWKATTASAALLPAAAYIRVEGRNTTPPIWAVAPRLERHYFPPPLHKDIPVFVQSFLL